MFKTLLGGIAALVFLAGPVGAQAVAGPAQGAVAPTSLSSQLVVYYFHGNARCSSCYKIEQYTREAVEENFAQEMQSGKVVFKMVNVDRGGNGHFVEDYQLYTKSVVLSLVKSGQQVKYKNLEKVWELIRDENMFHDYVRDEVKPLLGEL